MKKNWQVVLIIFILLFLLIAFMPERNNWTILLVFPLWIVFILYFTLCLSLIITFWPESMILYCVFAIHHLIVTAYILITSNFDYKVIIFNIILSCFGIIFLWFKVKI